MEPEEYRQQINALGLGELKKMSISNQSDAEKVLERVQDLQEGLHHINCEVNADIKRINESYGTVAPYEKVISDVETLLTRLDTLKMQLEDYIQKAIKEKPSQAIAKEFCPQCGTAIDVADKFCSNCGKRLCCPYCGNINSQSDKFCSNCGQELFFS